jgi:hypothetical protein
MQYFSTMPDTTYGTGFQLISNIEYQVAARNAEAVGANWSTGTVGSGFLYRGHVDGLMMLSPPIAGDTLSTKLHIPSSNSDSNGYFLTGNSAGSGPDAKRTFVLSNGVSIWDLSGNGTTTTTTAIDTNLITASAGTVASGLTFPLYTTSWAGGYTPSFLDQLSVGSVIASTAQLAGSADNTSSATLSRGVDGLFAVYQYLISNNLYRHTFRCVYVPPTAPPAATGTLPQIRALQRVDGLDNIQTEAVTIAKGGTWNIKWVVSDAESSNVEVEVYRKIATTATDFPTTADSTYLYTSGNNLQFLQSETAWVGTTSNNGKYVNYVITATDGDSNQVTSAISVPVTTNCPSGYVGVPGNAVTALGNPNALTGATNKWLDPSLAFCVMKYPAKNVGGVATSVKENTPWVNINRADSMTACAALGSNYRLISNTQWQVMARNIDTITPMSWYNYMLGNVALITGYTAGGTGNVLDNDIDTNPFYGTDLAARHRRTFALSNGQLLWDISGNIYHWVSDLKSELTSASAALATAGWATITSASTTDDKLLTAVARISATVTSATSFTGSYYGGTGGGVIRGGGRVQFSSGTEDTAGVSGAYFGNAVTATDGYLGFRCVYMP